MQILIQYANPHPGQMKEELIMYIPKHFNKKSSTYLELCVYSYKDTIQVASLMKKNLQK